MLHKLLPDWMMQSLYQMQNFRQEIDLYYAWVEFLPVYTLSNMMRFVCRFDSGLLDTFYIHLKFMMDCFNDVRAVAGSIVPVYLNMMLAEDRLIEMTQLYPTDEEQRARNPVGQKGVSTAMIAAFLGKETFANISANC